MQCPVYLQFPCLGKVTSFFETKLKEIVSNIYDAVKLRVAHFTRKPYNGNFKDVTPDQEQHNVIYLFDLVTVIVTTSEEPYNPLLTYYY